MKKIQFLIITLLVVTTNASAQDMLVMKSGNIEKVKVAEITSKEIKYRKYNNLNGPLFSIMQSKVLSITFENGEIQKFNTHESKITKLTNVFDNPKYSWKDAKNGKILNCYNHDVKCYSKGWNSTFDLMIQDGWGVGASIRYNFNKYLTYDVFCLTYMSGFTTETDPSKQGLASFRIGGLRIYTPSYKMLRGYMNLDLGYTLSYQGYYEHTIINDVHYRYDIALHHVYINHGFGLDFGIGIQLHKNFALGYNLNYGTQFMNPSHWCKLSVIF